MTTNMSPEVLAIILDWAKDHVEHGKADPDGDLALKFARALLAMRERAEKAKAERDKFQRLADDSRERADRALVQMTDWQARAERAEAARDEALRAAAEEADKVGQLRTACAAKDAALDHIRAWASNHKTESRTQLRGTMRLIHETAEDALSPSAGEALHRVVTRVRLIVGQDTGDIWTEDHGWVRPIKPETVNDLADALAAYEGDRHD